MTGLTFFLLVVMVSCVFTAIILCNSLYKGKSSSYYDSDKVVWHAITVIILGVLATIFGIIIGIGMCVPDHKSKQVRIRGKIYHCEYLIDNKRPPIDGFVPIPEEEVEKILEERRTERFLKRLAKLKSKDETTEELESKVRAMKEAIRKETIKNEK